jgi:hypothetical protein
MAIRIPSVPSSIPSWDARAIVRPENSSSPYNTLQAADENILRIPVSSIDTYTWAAVRIIAASNSANPLAVRQFSVPYYFTPYIANKNYIEIPAHIFLYSEQKGSKSSATWSDNSTTISISNTSGLEVGMPILGSGIYVGSVIESITTNTSITISRPTTAAKSGGTGSFNYYYPINYENLEKIQGYNQYYKIQIKLINTAETIDINVNGKWVRNSTIITTGWLEDTVTNGYISPWSQEILGRPILIQRTNSEGDPIIGIQNWISRNEDGTLYEDNTIDAGIFSFNGIFEEPNERIQSYKITIHYNNNSIPPEPLVDYEFDSSGTTFFPNYSNPSIEWVNSKILNNNSEFFITFEYTTESGFSESIRYKAGVAYSVSPLGLTYEATNDNDNGRLEFLISGTQVRFEPATIDSTYTWIPNEDLATKIQIDAGSIKNKNVLIWNAEYQSWGIHSIVTGITPFNKIPETVEELEDNYIFKISSDSLFRYYVVPVSFTEIEYNLTTITQWAVGLSISIGKVVKYNNIPYRISFVNLPVTEIPIGATAPTHTSGSVAHNGIIYTVNLINKVYNDFYFIKRSTNENSNSLQAVKFFSNINISFNRSLSNTTDTIIQSDCVAYLRTENFTLSPYSTIASNITYELYFGEQLGKQFLYVKDLTNDKVDRLHT